MNNLEFYIQCFIIIPFFFLFIRSISLVPQQNEEEPGLNSEYFSKNYSQLNDDEVHHHELKKYRKTAEENSSLFGILTFQWLSPVFVTGYKRALEMGDLNFLKGIDHSHESLKLFYKSWRKQLKNATDKNIKYNRDHNIDHNNKVNVNVLSEPLMRQQSDQGTAPKHEEIADNAKYQPSLLRAILSAFGGPYFIAGPLKLIYDCFQYSGPLILSAYLHDAERFNNDSNDHAQHEAYMYAGLLFTAYICATLILAQYFHRCFRTGMRVRAALMGVCYEKALKLSQSAKSTRTQGEIMNLVTVDVRKIRDVFPYSWMLISAPFQISLALYLLYQQIGWAVFVGLAIQTLFMAPLQAIVGINARKIQKKLMKMRDKRMGVVNEVFGAMKIVKMYAWEISFGNKISTIRAEELSTLRCYVWWYTIMILFWGFAPTFTALAAFIAFTINGGELTAERAFTSVALFNLLRFPLAMLPMVVLAFIDANVCLGRLTKFLTANEINDDLIEYFNGNTNNNNNNNNNELLSNDDEEKVDNNNNNNKSLISLDNVSFTWDDAGNQPALHDLNADFQSNTVTMIIGETGSGKSALLRGILGNLPKIQGHLLHTQDLRIAYSSQVAWIQNMTLKDNILFGNEFDLELYNKVLSACALIDDLKILPGGDETEIGEKGINLSGGQKQRISVARAVYSNSDLYIFDDPLSAVDAHVANHIFNECFMQLLKGKTIILATHAVSFLKYADNILVMEEGEIKLQGKLQVLLDNKINLTKFIIHKDDEDGDQDDLDEDKEKKEDNEDKKDKKDKNDKKDKKDNKSQAKDGKLVDDEIKGVGNVSAAVYWLYVQAAGGIALFLLYVGFLGSYYSSQIGATFWLAFWSDDSLAHKSQYFYLNVYTTIQMSTLLFLFSAAVVGLITRLRASKILHESLLQKMLHAPMSFFDTTPIGRIINRFSRDMYAIDNAVPGSYQSAIRIMLYLLSVTIGVCIVTPWFSLSLIPLGVVYYYLQKYFIATSRELRRLSSLMNSPIYSNFSESIIGSDTIKAFGKSAAFSSKVQAMVDSDHEAYYPSVAANRWLAIRLELIGNSFIGAAALFCAITEPSAGYIGVALSTVMSVTQSLNWFVRQKAQLEQDIVAVERIDQYSNKDTVQELPYVIQSNRPNKAWPADGEIIFNNVFMKYRPELEYVLKGLSFKINAGEKIGVIGRTGAGKSSLFITLLRIVEIEKIAKENQQKCQIIIDNVDISEIGLQDLRSKLSVIPQDPVLFTGSVRFNLDPFDAADDERLVNALKLSHCYDALKKMIIEITIKKEKDDAEKKEKEENEKKNKKNKNEKNKDEKNLLSQQKKNNISIQNNPKMSVVSQRGVAHRDSSIGSMSKSKFNISQYIDNPKYRDLNPLDIEVEENGANFSVGQRQLLCLARAIVRGSKILLLDEATSAVDPSTDQLIQKTIRDVFKNNTILTIAHRIDTILDYDKILIMDNGTVLEYDTPKTLLKNKNSKFSNIVQESFGVNLDDVIKNKMNKEEEEGDGD